MALAAGCAGPGGGGPAEEEPPALPGALALQLAAQSEGVADALAAGDTCDADARADALRDAILAAVNGGRIPGPFQEELVGAANGLAERIGCR